MKTHLFNGNWLLAVDDYGRVQAAEITDHYHAGLKPAIGDWEVIGEIPMLDCPTAPAGALTADADSFRGVAEMAHVLFVRNNWIWASTSPNVPTVEQIEAEFRRLVARVESGESTHSSTGRLFARLDDTYGLEFGVELGSRFKDNRGRWGW